MNYFSSLSFHLSFNLLDTNELRLWFSELHFIGSFILHLWMTHIGSCKYSSMHLYKFVYTIQYTVNILIQLAVNEKCIIPSVLIVQWQSSSYFASKISIKIQNISHAQLFIIFYLSSKIESSASCGSVHFIFIFSIDYPFVDDSFVQSCKC